MVFDSLSNAHLYFGLSSGISTALQFLLANNLNDMPIGKYPIQGDEIFIMVQEYDTLDAATEQMEAHRKFIDVQYMIQGTELVGHDVLHNQTISRPYNSNDDFLLVSNKPAFFSAFNQGTFMVFFPTDLHMPCIINGHSSKAKKAVIKVLNTNL